MIENGAVPRSPTTFDQKVPKFESPPHTIRWSAYPDSILICRSAITPHFRTHVFDLFYCSTCLTRLLVSFSPAVQSMYLHHHFPLVSQIISINPNAGELSYAVVFRFAHSCPLRLHRFQGAKCIKRSKSHPSSGWLTSPRDVTTASTGSGLMERTLDIRNVLLSTATMNGWY